MSIDNAQVTVGTTATVVADNSGGVTKETVTLHNKGGASVFVGDSAVTTATGYELATGEVSEEISLSGGEKLYAICASGTVRVDREGSR